MSKVVWKLREDHRNMARLLNLVGREIDVFEKGEHPDYELIETILDYLMNFPDHLHHPVEDMIYRKLEARDPEAVKSIGDLTGEHERLYQSIHRFFAALQNVLQDETLPRDWFSGVAREYHDSLLRHMQMEEVLFLPAAMRALSAEEWKEIETELGNEKDPLFGGEADRRYKALHKEIMDWSEELDETG